MQGIMFHKIGPMAERAHFLGPARRLWGSLAKGTCIKPLLLDLMGWADATEVRQSPKSPYLMPWRALKISSSILNWTCKQIGNQCSWKCVKCDALHFAPAGASGAMEPLQEHPHVDCITLSQVIGPWVAMSRVSQSRTKHSWHTKQSCAKSKSCEFRRILRLQIWWVWCIPSCLDPAICLLVSHLVPYWAPKIR